MECKYIEVGKNVGVWRAVGVSPNGIALCLATNFVQLALQVGGENTKNTKNNANIEG